MFVLHHLHTHLSRLAWQEPPEHKKVHLYNIPSCVDHKVLTTYRVSNHHCLKGPCANQNHPRPVFPEHCNQHPRTNSVNTTHMIQTFIWDNHKQQDYKNKKMHEVRSLLCLRHPRKISRNSSQSRQGRKLSTGLRMVLPESPNLASSSLAGRDHNHLLTVHSSYLCSTRRIPEEAQFMGGDVEGSHQRCVG